MLIHQDFSQWYQRLALAFSTHWFIILTTAAGMNIGLALSAPLLMMWGWEGLGKPIYRLYSLFCHQFAHSSWFIFGQRPFYDSKLLFELTGIESGNAIARLASRDFYGNSTIGWKTAYCQRDLAIFAGVFSASLFYGILRDRQYHIRPVPLILYLLFGLAPIALDGLSQILSQPLPFLPIMISHESSPMLRTATGFLFGFMNVWLAYPHLETWMSALRKRRAPA